MTVLKFPKQLTASPSTCSQHIHGLLEQHANDCQAALKHIREQLAYEFRSRSSRDGGPFEHHQRQFDLDWYRAYLLCKAQFGEHKVSLALQVLGFAKPFRPTKT